MSMTGHQDEAAYIIGGSAVLNVVLTLVLTPTMGPLGTALATLVAVVARSVALSWYIWTRMHIMPLPFGRRTQP
jgi:O-antigen/teichoic acid export membrane protein